MKERFGFAIVLLGVVVILSSCKQEAEPPSEPEARPVKLVTASADPPAKLYFASGVIAAAQRAELSFERFDVLTDLPVSQGQKVSEGDMLAQIDTRNLEIQRQAARARFDEADAQHKRMQRLYERQAVALADLDRARAAFEVAQSELNRVQKELDQSVLRAPFAGLIAVTLVDRYQMVQARQPVLVLHDLSSFDMKIYLPETFILNVGRTTDVRATAAFDHLPGREFPVTFKNVSTEANPETLTYAVSFRLTAPEGQPILPGMSASIRIAVPGPLPGDAAACWIPVSAVFSTDGTTSAVWVVDPKEMRVRRSEVKTGTLREESIQILEGLSSGDQVAISGLHSLREGQRVRPYPNHNDG